MTLRGWIILALFIQTDAFSASSVNASKAKNFEASLHILNQTLRGRALVSRALEFWKLKSVSDLKSVFEWSEVSRTDTVLTRHFDVKTGKEERDRKTTIYLKQGQQGLELILDISHELVHATSRPSWDPYDSSLTAGKYILAAIEGEGGEVEAVREECEIEAEIISLWKEESPTHRCDQYKESTQILISKEKIREDFYRVGEWKSEVEKRLGKENLLFPLLSAEAPKLYSSTGHAPYPLALLKEFDELTWVACENSKNRIKHSSKSFPQDTLEKLKNFLAKRC